MNNIEGVTSNMKGLFEELVGESTGLVEAFFDASSSLFALGVILLLVFLLILIPFVIVYIIGLWKLFKKCGKDGWEAIVPFYNTYVLVEIAGLNWWYFLIAIAGTVFSGLGILGQLASMAVNFFVFYNLAKKFKKEPILWAIVGTIVSPIAAMIFGFASSFVYDSSIEVSKNGPINK